MNSAPTPSIHAPVLIIGSGPAGYTAGLYAARAGLQPLLIQGLQPGGQLATTTDVENYPGFAEIIQGPWLMEQMCQQAEKCELRIINDTITKVDFQSRRLYGDSGQIYTADAIIIATGARARWLGLPSEASYRGHGVSACATCDGFFFRRQDVAVVGGGNAACEEALFLTRFARKVTLIHRRDRLRGEKTLHQRVLSHPLVEVLWNHIVEGIQGEETFTDGTIIDGTVTDGTLNEKSPAIVTKRVTGVQVRDIVNGLQSTLPVQGVFIAVGHDPASAIFRGQIELDQDGYITTAPGSSATSLAGVFAAGDVTDRVYRQAVTAAGMGCMAALEAGRFLAGT